MLRHVNRLHHGHELLAGAFLARCGDANPLRKVVQTRVRSRECLLTKRFVQRARGEYH